MNDKVIKVYKKAGFTPLECINILKNDHENLRLLPMTYAGRLDPLAEGLLLILVGDECLKKDEYLNLPKVYEVDVLFGFATDTYDVMGKIMKDKTSSEILFKRSSDEGGGIQGQTILNSTFDYVPEIKEVIPNFIGKIKQPYPPYSSRPVKGKPLFMWAREEKLGDIEIPIHDVNVSDIEILEEREISGKDLLEKIKEDIGKVSGDFRQKEMLALWEINLRDKYEEKYSVVKLKVSCGSGAYMRVIANDIGKELGVPALALSIKRTRIGDYEIN